MSPVYVKPVPFYSKCGVTSGCDRKRLSSTSPLKALAIETMVIEYLARVIPKEMWVYLLKSSALNRLYVCK